MSQLGPKERSATSKSESKQLKCVKSSIARTQAKVDAKLTQSRLLPALSPSKYENDPLHPPLDLSPSREEQSSSNVTSSHEQPKDVAKELFPDTDSTGNAAKERGALEQQQHFKPLAPPTGTEKILDTKPKDTHINFEGNHSCDAHELEVTTSSFLSSNMKGSPRPLLSTDHEQSEDIAREHFASSANTGNAAKGKPSLCTRSLAVFPPPPPPPLPDTAKEEVVSGGIENPSGKDHPPDEALLFCQTSNPDGVFGAFCEQRKLLLSAHNQQALWAEPYNDGELGLDGNQMILQHYHCQQIYEAMRPTIDLSASDGCTFFHKLNTTVPTACSTVTHNNFHSLSEILHHHPRFYIFPHPQDYYNNQKTFGHTWSKWAKKIGEVRGEAFQSGVLYEGSFIMPGMEDNLSAQTLYMNPLNPGMISLAPWICGIHCLRDARTYNPTVHSDGVVRPVSLNDPMYPYFHIRLSTETKHHVSIAYGDIMVPHSSLQWAVNKVNNEIQLPSVKSTLRFEIARHLLPHFKVPPKSTLDKMSNRERGEYRRRRGNAPDCFVLINQLFHFHDDKILVRTDNAKYPEERIQPLTPSSERMFRFHYTIPSPLAKELLGRVMSQPLWTMGKVFAINGANLAPEITFKITPSRAFKRASPDFYPVDVWRAILTSEAARRCGVLGAIPHTYNKFYVCMDYNHMPVIPNKDSLTTMSFMLFQENNLVTYRGTTGAMISWGGYASWRAKHPGLKIDLPITRHAPEALASPTTPTLTPQYVPTPKPENPMLVEVHSPANTPDVDVMFAMGLLGKIKHITLYSSKIARVRVYHVTYATRESAILATGFRVGQIVFHPEVPDSLKRDSMLGPSNLLVNERYDFVSRILAAAAAYGSAEQLKVANEHYLTPINPLTLTEKVSQLAVQDSDDWETIEGLPGAFLAPDFFSEDRESLVTAWAEDPELDWSEEGQRCLIHHGHTYDPKLKSVTAVDRHPPDFVAAMGLQAHESALTHTQCSLPPANMWSLAEYEPGSGVKSHVDVGAPGSYLLSGSFGSGAEIVFEPRPFPNTGPPKGKKRIFLQRRPLLLLTGDSRSRWKHLIPARDFDLVEKKKIPREKRLSLLIRSTHEPPGPHPLAQDPR